MMSAGGHSTEPGRVLAVDHGTLRIGVAISDPLRMFARPLVTLESRALDDPAAAITDLALEWEASDVVVGVPLLPSGTAGEQAVIVFDFIESLRAVMSERAPEVSLRTIDESDSTRDAESMRAAAGGSKKKRAARKGRSRSKDVGLDAFAAAVILETWLREA